MSRSRGVLLLSLLVVVVLGVRAAAAAVPVAVRVMAARNASLNATVLVTQRGMTLYHLGTEEGGKIACTGACASVWPPLLVSSSAKLAAGPGVSKGKLGTVRRPDGRRQVTYAGLALYRYSGDRKAG